MGRRPAIAWTLCLALFLGCGQGKLRYPSADVYYDEALKALNKGKCYRATQLFRNLLSDFPGSHYVDDAQYGMGQASFCSRDYVTAVFEYERLLNEYPTSPFTDEARYQIGMCYYEESRDVHHDQEDTRKAIREFRRFIEDYPNSERVPDAQDRIRELKGKIAEKNLMVAENYLKWNRPMSAVRYCELILVDYEEPDVVDRARYLLARAKRKLGELDEALQILVPLAADDVPLPLRKDVLKEIEDLRGQLNKRAQGSGGPDVDGEEASESGADRAE